MGSKKLKRKKLKLKKGRKINPINREEGKSFESCNGTDPEEKLQEKNIDNRLSPKNNSRSYTERKDVSDVKYFSKIREDYFKYLQMVVSDNCVFCDSPVTEEMLENLALELEQNALLACLQVDIYKKSMLKIIRDIKKCTEEKQVHKDVRKLLPGSLEEKSFQVNSTNFPVETYNRIPTIASIRTDDHLVGDRNIWANQSNYNPGPFY